MVGQSITSVFDKRYVIEDLLGQGGMGQVYRAKDRLTGRIIALKRVRTPSQQALFGTSESGVDMRLALAQEFQMLASLRHPHIITVLDYGFDAEHQPYFTMDLLLNAQSIDDAGRGKSRAAQVGLLIQILQALAYLHRRGIIHRDLKPANVLVKDEQVKVLDFGLATIANQQAKDEISGTLAYLAPEILNQQPAGITTDLYAVGLIAYELLTDHYPFNTKDNALLIDDILHKTPDMSAIGVDSPLALVVGRLLAKAPEERYPDAHQVIEALCEALDQRLPAEDRAIRDSFLQAAPLIGRERELATLSKALLDALDGKGNAWLIGGESGVGKSRLLNELATLALIHGALVLRGQAVQEGAQPFQIWREPLRWLALTTDLTDAEASILKELVLDIESLLDRPVLKALPLEAPAQQARLLAAIIAIFRRQQQSMVMILEDLQWVGEESLSLLRQLNATAAEMPLLIIANYRDDERPDLPQLLPDMSILKLHRLLTDQVAQLSESMLGKNGRQPEIVDFLQRQTEGNVFFLIEVVRVLAEETGQLANVGNINLPDHIFVGGIQRIIERRLERISQQALPLLRAAAVFGREIDLAILEAIDPSINIQVWLTECANAAVLDVLTERWRFAHDKLRDGVLAALESEMRRKLHEQIAQAIEVVYPNTPAKSAALAYHWGMAGNRLKEAHYAELAGEQARQISAGGEAVAFFKRALELTPDPRAKAKLMTRIAESLFWLGEFNANRQYNIEALAIAREHNDDKIISTALSSLGNTAIQQGQFAVAASYHQESLQIARTTQDFEVLSHALAGLGDVAWRTGDYAQAMVYLQENLAVAERVNNLTIIGNAQNMLGIVYAMLGQLDKSKESFQDSLKISRRTGERSRMAQALSNLGEVAMMEDSYDEALQYFEEALNLSREASNRYSMGNIQLNLGLIVLTLGRPDQAENYFLQALQNAHQIDSGLLVLGVLGGFARLEASRGRKQRALELIGLVIYHPGSSTDLQNMLTKGILNELKEQVPPVVFTAALERGKTLDLAETIKGFLADNQIVQKFIKR